MKAIEKKVYEIILPYTDKLNLEIYDIVYAKQGKDMYLSIYIDKAEGVNIDDCEQLSRMIEEPIDENVDIKEQYFLEVSSSGLEKVIRTDEHLKKFLNNIISVNLFKQLDGQKNISGLLLKYDDESITILCDDKEYQINRKDISLMKTVYNFDDEDIEGGDM